MFTEQFLTNVVRFSSWLVQKQKFRVHKLTTNRGKLNTGKYRSYHLFFFSTYNTSFKKLVILFLEEKKVVLTNTYFFGSEKQNFSFLISLDSFVFFLRLWASCFFRFHCLVYYWPWQAKKQVFLNTTVLHLDFFSFFCVPSVLFWKVCKKKRRILWLVVTCQ